MSCYFTFDPKSTLYSQFWKILELEILYYIPFAKEVHRGIYVPTCNSTVQSHLTVYVSQNDTCTAGVKRRVDFAKNSCYQFSIDSTHGLECEHSH